MAKQSSSGISFISAALIIFFFFTTLIVSETEARYQVKERGKSSPNQAQTVSKRQLIGSTPPSCQVRCGRCRPCQPVQVAIQPGTVVTPMEYYPIVWRCQCGNKLYLP